MLIISVANQKGGCGKTTTAINLSASFAYLGKRALLIDLDPQGHSTIGLGFDADQIKKSLYDVLSPAQVATSLEEIIIHVNSNHHLVPSQVILSAIEQQLSGVYGREEKLLEKILSVGDQYDYVIIDCPPNLGLLTFNALRASQEIIIPAEPSHFSIQGLKKIHETVDLVRDTLKHHIKTHVLLTLYNSQSNFNKSIVSEIRELFGEEVLTSVIHQNIKLKEAIRVGKSICDYDPKSKGFRDYISCACELIERHAEKKTVSNVVYLDNHLEKENKLDNTESIVSELLEDGVHDSETIENLELKIDSTENGTITLGKTTPTSYPHLEKEGVTFGFIEKEARLVQVAGDFNNWVNESMEKTSGNSGVWEKFFDLAPGTYRYKFIVDGEWTVDPFNDLTEPNPYGGIDSVLEISEIKEENLNERTSEIKE